MTTTHPNGSTMLSTATAPTLTGAEVCRLTVVGPGGSADLAVPVATPLSALLPLLLRRLGTPAPAVAPVPAQGAAAAQAAAPAPAPAVEPGTAWVLQRLGEEPLDPDGTVESHRLRHGETLHLRPADDPLPALHFDDLADGVGHVVSARPGRWEPRTTRQLALALAVLALLALAAGLLGGGPGATTALGAGATAVLLGAAAAAAALSRDRATAGARSVAAVAGLGALAFGALAGLTFRPGPHGGYAPGLPGVLTAAACVSVLAIALLALRALPPQLPGTALLTAAAAAVGAALTQAAHWHGAQAAGIVAGGLFVIGHFGPRLALRAARLRVPPLPHNAEELQQDLDPEPQERVEQRVGFANACLDVLSLGSGLVYAAGFWYLTHDHGWIGWVLPLVLAAAVLLRARSLARTLQRLPTVLSAALGLAVLLLVRAVPGGPGHRLALLAVLLLAAAALLLAALRLPTARLLPIWGHVGDRLETATTVALLPLLLQTLHAYGYFRSLAG
ncbi:type VII secretion integral membrane protein EccD [Kitasatospora sp. NBC_01287]|uniref:type VII secretion integral membrane protein EccD n=1 Tax=Kitasatospora sp. NBC_01287 TaxID=2903573 RepID=UPI00225C2F37|nr:type VII secretion integral membrane protein EccD [Kitasatospora sp. NBC_01287]MCX4744013.1 type VII secretion integral membrane protein EccD [Kitasatospora sp. NBC_01287]